MKKSNKNKKISFKIMYITFISAIISLLSAVFIDSIYSLASLNNNANIRSDYIIDIPKNKSNNKVEKIKQYKERIDYDKETISSEIKDYKHSIITDKDTQNIESAEEINKQININFNKTIKPKLAIIIDDIANEKQINEILKIDLKLTPSIFPISNKNKDMIAAINKLDFFMIHLPLEAKQYKDGLDTIKIKDSKERIEKKIKDIKEILPNVKYINNHTGSKFTENKNSMETLLQILDNHNINFIDSRTTPNSVINKIAKENNKVFLYRDIFVDNVLLESSLNTQLKNGVAIAKKKGYAILIAHPHKETLKAIKLAKDNILKSVDIVYVNEIDNLININLYSKKSENKWE